MQLDGLSPYRGMVSALGGTRDRRAISSIVASASSKHAAKSYDYSLSLRAKTRQKQAE
jgi:hypothetical protein